MKFSEVAHLIQRMHFQFLNGQMNHMRTSNIVHSIVERKLVGDEIHTVCSGLHIPVHVSMNFTTLTSGGFSIMEELSERHNVFVEVILGAPFHTFESNSPLNTPQPKVLEENEQSLSRFINVSNHDSCWSSTLLSQVADLYHDKKSSYTTKNTKENRGHQIRCDVSATFGTQEFPSIFSPMFNPVLLKMKSVVGQSSKRQLVSVAPHSFTNYIL